MASVLEYISEALQLSSQSHTTPVARLAIDNSIGKLEADSKKYFEIKHDAKAENEKLAITVDSQEKFNPTNPDHIRYLSRCTDLFKEKSKALKEIDQRIMMAAVVGLVATSLSFLPLVGLLSIAGWCTSLYYTYHRKTAYDEYSRSLNLLVVNCNWSIGPKAEDRVADIRILTLNADIRAMMTELYPVLNKSDVENLVANDIEQIFLAELNSYENSFKPGGAANNFFKDDNIALSRKGAEFTRCIYGYNKGSATDFLDAFLSILPDIWHAAENGIAQLKNWYASKAETPAPAM